MTSAMTAFAIAVVGVSVACYLLMSRAESRRARRGPSGPDGSSYPGSNDASAWSLFAGGHSSIDSSGNPADGGGGDSGGGGDGGGGDGGGGSD